MVTTGSHRLGAWLQMRTARPATATHQRTSGLNQDKLKMPQESQKPQDNWDKNPACKPLGQECHPELANDSKESSCRELTTKRAESTNASVKSPSLYALKPCKEDPAYTTSVGCLIKDYFPDTVAVNWYPDSLNKSITNFPAVGSELKVTTSQLTTWDKSVKKFTCHVEHKPSVFNGSLPIAVTPRNITRPTVRLLHSSCDPNAFHSTIQLYCFIYGHILNDVAVSWLQDGKKINKISNEILIKTEGKLASTYSELNITQEEWMSESTFTCVVTSQMETYSAYAQKCPEYEPCGVNTYLIPPSPLDLYVLKTPKLTCLVVDLESKDNVTVTWTQEHRKTVGSVTQSFATHRNATTSITSILSVDTKDWIEGAGYRCTVTHPDFPKPIVRAITKAPGKRSAPEVYVFPPPEEENKDKRTLTCLIQNFFPEDISVQWLQDEMLIPDTHHSTTAPLLANGSKRGFFIFSRLEVTKAQWTRSKQFTCRVIHEALREPRKLEKSVSKSPELDLQDLCTEEAESEELEELWTSTCIFITLFLLSVSYGAAVTLLKVKWVFSTLMQGVPQTLHDYANILQTRA